jgi:L-threonylcarbamoyladenylate synthase
VTLVIANPEHRYPLASRDVPETLGVRLIKGPLGGAMTPVFQTSANRTGGPAPRSFEEIDEQVLAGADLAIDGGELIGAPSTVIDITELDGSGSWEVLREGALPQGVIDRILGDTGAG